MIFNSLIFIYFMVVVYTAYWSVNRLNLSYQNILLLGCSYFFYGFWDYRFLSLIVLSTIVDYLCGLYLVKAKPLHKKIILALSLVFNLGLLMYFKYAGFFIDSFISLLHFFNYSAESKFGLNIILPVGISFYTFQTMSYTIDIYKGKLKPTKDFLSFAAFVAFFPQLVAGPIERATNLLPQILRKRKFNLRQSREGLSLILWGFFKKIIIADSLSPMVDDIFLNYQDYGGLTIFLGALYFTIQIYCDFSGYSDIAIGIAKTMGIELMLNFNFPYFSQNISQFWKRWHISLSTWFRDYLYIPLGGSRINLRRTLINMTIVFLVSGFWHGANWTFIVWGLAHAIIYLFYFLTKEKLKKVRISPLQKIIQTVLFFILIVFTWIIFRSDTIYEAYQLISKIFTTPNFTKHLNPYNNLNSLFYLNYVVLFLVLDYIQMRRQNKNSLRFSNLFDIAFITVIILFMQIDFANSFIYFQF